MLLEARKHPLLERAYARYGRRLLRRAFARVWVGGAPWPEGAGPVIAFVNHSAWWDPVLALFLSHDVFRRDGYGLMEGAQLLRYPFFRRIGCFGATGEHPAEDARGLALYAARLLRDAAPGAAPRTLWIFPQGALLPARVPLAFRSGLARFSRAVPGAVLLPVAVRYELRADQRPECFVRIGMPVHAGVHVGGHAGVSAESPGRLTRRLEHRLRDELDRLDDDLAAEHPAGYRVALAGRGSLSDFYDRTMGRWRGRPGVVDG
jgi:1-acyl-sn-glycerol-3-phosphate acyltransferase